MTRPTFAQAKAKTLPAAFGDYGGKTLDDIASSDKGLLFLDALRGRAKAPWLQEVLGVYLDDPAIQADLRRALDNRRR